MNPKPYESNRWSAWSNLAEAVDKYNDQKIQAGLKFDQDKPKWSLVPKGVMNSVVRVLTFGARKYAPDNWKKVHPERYYDALWRHVEAYRNGESHDPETGEHHLAHGICCLMFMLWIETNEKPKNPDL